MHICSGKNDNFAPINTHYRSAYGNKEETPDANMSVFRHLARCESGRHRRIVYGDDSHLWHEVRGDAYQRKHVHRTQDDA